MTGQVAGARGRRTTAGTAALALVVGALAGVPAPAVAAASAVAAAEPTVSPAEVTLPLPRKGFGYVRTTVATDGLSGQVTVTAEDNRCPGSGIVVRPGRVTVSAGSAASFLVLVSGAATPGCPLRWRLEAEGRSAAVEQRVTVAALAAGADPGAVVRRVAPGGSAPFTATVDVPAGPDPLRVTATADCPPTVGMRVDDEGVDVPGDRETPTTVRITGRVADRLSPATGAGSPAGTVTSCTVSYHASRPAAELLGQQAIGVDVVPGWTAEPAAQDVAVRAGGESPVADVALTLPRVAPTAPADLLLLVDGTAAFGPVLQSLRADAPWVVGLARTVLVDARIGLAVYAGHEPPIIEGPGPGLLAAAGPLDVRARIGRPDDRGEEVLGALSRLAAGPTSGPTRQLEALHRVPDAETVGWRSGARPFVLWLGGNAGYEPACVGGEGGVDRDDVGKVLARADIRLLPVNVVVLDDPPPLPGLDSSTSAVDCGPAVNRSNQATDLSTATSSPAPVRAGQEDAVAAVFGALVRPPDPVQIGFRARCPDRDVAWVLTGDTEGTADSGERTTVTGNVTATADARVGSTYGCELRAVPQDEDRTAVVVSRLRVRVLAAAGLELPGAVDVRAGDSAVLTGVLRVPNFPGEGDAVPAAGTVDCAGRTVSGTVSVPDTVPPMSDQPVAVTVTATRDASPETTVDCTVTVILDRYPDPVQFARRVAVRVLPGPGLDPPSVRQRMLPGTEASLALTIRPPRTDRPKALLLAAACDPGLTVALAVPSVVDGGEEVTGVETVRVAADAELGAELRCTVTGSVDGKPDERLRQDVTIRVAPPPGVDPRSAVIGLLPGDSGDVPLTVYTSDPEGEEPGAVTVTAAATCQAGARATAAPAAQEVPRGGVARLVVTVEVDAGTAPGRTLGCDVRIAEDGRTGENLTTHIDVVVAPPPAADPATDGTALDPGGRDDLPWTVTTGPVGEGTVTLRPVYACTGGVSATAVPEQVEVRRGEPARFIDRLSVPASAWPGDVLTCTVSVAVAGRPVRRTVSVLVTGISPDRITVPIVRGGTGAVARRLVLASGADATGVRAEARCPDGVTSSSVVRRRAGRTELEVRESLSVAANARPGDLLDCTTTVAAPGRPPVQVHTSARVLDAGVRPPSAQLTLDAGRTGTVPTTVTLPPTPPPDRVDMLLLADTTGSMGAALEAVQGSARGMLATMRALARDPRFGAADYRDVGDRERVFTLGAAIPAADDAGRAAERAIGEWTAGGGGDVPEAQLLALHRLATGAARFRDGGLRIVVWFGDAPAIDPLCAADVALEKDLTEAGVTAELRTAGITVVAVSLDGGLDAVPDRPPAGRCGGTADTGGQATRIAAATGGSVVTAEEAADVPGLLVQAVGSRLLDLRPVVAACDSGLRVSATPPAGTAAGGSVAEREVTVRVDPAAGPGVRRCVLDWRVGGRDLGPLFRQTIQVTTPAGGGGGVGAPAVTVSPVVIHPGGVVTVTVIGFPALQNVLVDLPGSEPAQVRVDGRGRGSVVRVILRRDVLGASTVTAAAATPGGARATAVVIIQKRIWAPPLPGG